jgi:single-strand DNA-binding protein
MLITGIARLGRDAEIRYTPSGEKVANLALAFNYGKKGADGKRPAQWLDAALWGDRAEALGPYLLKGTAIGVTISDPHIETFTTRDNRQGSKLVGRIIDLEFAGGARQEGGAPTAPKPANTQAPTPAPSTGGGGSFADFEDDIPF